MLQVTVRDCRDWEEGLVLATSSKLLPIIVTLTQIVKGHLLYAKVSEADPSSNLFWTLGKSGMESYK